VFSLILLAIRHFRARAYGCSFDFIWLNFDHRWF